MEHFPSSLPRWLVVLLLACLSSIICADAQTVSNDTDQSWTVTTVAKGPGAPLRTTEKCSKSGSKVLCEKNVEVLGADGYRPSSYGERQKRGDNDRIETTKITKSADSGNGGLKLAEVNEKVVKQDGENRTTEESVSVADAEGKLAEVSRTVVRNTQSHGQNVETAETYSLDVPGKGRDGQFHLIQRVTTVRSGDAGRTTTEQQMEQIDPAGLDLKVMAKISDVATSGPAGTEETKTSRARNPDGTFSVSSVETSNSAKAPGTEPQSSPSNQPQ